MATATETAKPVERRMSHSQEGPAADLAVIAAGSAASAGPLRGALGAQANVSDVDHEKVIEGRASDDMEFSCDEELHNCTKREMSELYKMIKDVSEEVEELRQQNRRLRCQIKFLHIKLMNSGISLSSGSFSSGDSERPPQATKADASPKATRAAPAEEESEGPEAKAEGPEAKAQPQVVGDGELQEASVEARAGLLCGVPDGRVSLESEQGIGSAASTEESIGSDVVLVPDITPLNVVPLVES